MIPSPKVPTYDKQPEMSVQQVADKVAEVVKSKEYEFVMCNFAPPDMVRYCGAYNSAMLKFIQVGHTGVFDAAVQAIGATDAAVKTVYDACQDAGYLLLITADHGNVSDSLPHARH